MEPRWTLQELIDHLAVRPEAQLKKPSIRAEGKSLYMQFPPGLEEQTRPNLDKTLTELGLENGWEISVTDPAFVATFGFILQFKAAA